MRRRRRSHRRKNHTVRNIVISCFVITLLFATGYSAFQTNISINVKGNIKDYNTAWQLKKKVITSGDGLYRDIYENERYIYKGTNPSNFINFSGELWRIISVENDNSIKIVKNESIGQSKFDDSNNRYSSNSADYCKVANSGCNIFGSSSTTLDENDNHITQIIGMNGEILNLPVKESTISKYLNEEYINTIDRDKLILAKFGIGTVPDANYNNISEMLTNERKYKWEGYIGLLQTSDYVKASLNNDCTAYWGVCGTNNYLFNGDVIALMNRVHNGDSDTFYRSIRYININGGFNLMGYSSHDTFSIYPVVYLNPDIKINGEGTELHPYIIK